MAGLFLAMSVAESMCVRNMIDQPNAARAATSKPQDGGVDRGLDEHQSGQLKCATPHRSSAAVLTVWGWNSSQRFDTPQGGQPVFASVVGDIIRYECRDRHGNRQDSAGEAGGDFR